MAKQTFSVGQVLSAAQMTSLQATAMGGGTPQAKTTSYTLVAADAGTVIQMNSANATTITVNTSLFSAGDSVQIQNIGAGTCTITAGTATVNSAGSLAVTQYDGGFLYFSSASSALWFDYTQAGTTSPLTTKGDLYTRTSSADARLGVGTNGYTLVADSAEATGLKWAAPAGGSATYVGCAINNNASLTIATETATAILCGAEEYDSDGFHSTSSNTSRMTVPSGKAGKYQLTAQVLWSANMSSFFLLYVLKNGTAIGTGGFPGGIFSVQKGLPNDWISGTCTISLAVADYVEVAAYQSSGSNKTIPDAQVRIQLDYLGA
jgi:hypothetical protein